MIFVVNPYRACYYDDMLKKLKHDIDQSLKEFLVDVRKRYQLHLVSDVLFAGLKDFLQRDGKRIRPLLYLLSYRGYTARPTYSFKKLLRSSLSLELLHDFMLVHDDIIDKSVLRRGKPTLHRVYNKKIGVQAKSELGSQLSIVAGDIIFSLAIDAFLAIDEDLTRKEKALRKLAETAAFTGAGEFIDVVNSIRGLASITPKQIYLNYTFKTAKYTFECPLLIGAMLAGASAQELKKLSRLGIILGLAFQIQDDMLDMFASTKDIGKAIFSDLVESKKTMLVWRAYTTLSRHDRNRLNYLLEKKTKNKSDAQEFLSLIKKSNAHLYCFHKIRSLLKETYTIIRALRMKNSSKKNLIALCEHLFSKSKSFRLF